MKLALARAMLIEMEPKRAQELAREIETQGQKVRNPSAYVCGAVKQRAGGGRWGGDGGDAWGSSSKARSRSPKKTYRILRNRILRNGSRPLART